MRNWQGRRLVVASEGVAPSLRERLGGRWAISWQAFAITGVLAVVTLVVSARSIRDALIWGAIGVIAMGGVGVWTYAMHRTLFRGRKVTPVPIFVVVGAGFVGVLIFVLISISLGRAAGLQDDTYVKPDPVSTLPLVTAWGVILVLILESQWRFRVQRERLIEQAVQQRLASIREIDVLDQIRGVIRAEVDEELAGVRQRLEQQLDTLITQGEQGIGDLANELRNTADATVRPLSHRLEQQSRREHPGPGVLDILRAIVRHQPFRPVVVSAVYLISSAPGLVAERGTIDGGFTVLVTVLLIIATMSLVNLAMRRWPDHHAALFLWGIAFVQLPTLVIAPFMGDLTGVPVSTSDVLSSVVLGSIIIVVTSSFGSWNRSRQEVIRDFEKEVREDEIASLARSKALADTAREAATVLHGSVQSQLRACAAAVETATQSGDVVAVNRALVQAKAILEQPVPSLQRFAPRDLGDAVRAKAGEWQGLMPVECTIDPDAEKVSGPMAAHAADVVEEAIANAAHHGSASAVAIDIAREHEALLIVVTDDGNGPAGGPPGFGSSLLDRFGGLWSLTAAEQGTTLTVRIPEYMPKDSSAPAQLQGGRQEYLRGHPS